MLSPVETLLQTRENLAKLEVARRLLTEILASQGDFAEGDRYLSHAVEGIDVANAHLSLRECDLEEVCFIGK